MIWYWSWSFCGACWSPKWPSVQWIYVLDMYLKERTFFRIYILISLYCAEMAECVCSRRIGLAVDHNSFFLFLFCYHISAFTHRCSRERWALFSLYLYIILLNNYFFWSACAGWCLTKNRYDADMSGVIYSPWTRAKQQCSLFQFFCITILNDSVYPLHALVLNHNTISQKTVK